MTLLIHVVQQIINSIQYFIVIKQIVDKIKTKYLTSKKKNKNDAWTIYYKFPVPSSRDCLMKEPIFPTCTGDDGQRMYLIFSPSLIYKKYVLMNVPM